MAYKGRVTVAALLYALRQQILDAIYAQDTERLSMLDAFASFLSDLAAQYQDRIVWNWMDDMRYSISEAQIGSPKAEMPAAEAIKDTLAAADHYQGIQASIIRRTRWRSPKPVRGYMWNDAHESVFEPEWVGIARASGPYKETFDVMLYKFDGTLLLWNDFTSLEEALARAEREYDIPQSEWETCQIEIIDAHGHVPWIPQETEG